MIEPAIPPDVLASRAADPSLREFLDRLAADPTPFRWDPAREGVDLHCTVPTDRGPNRGRLKVFSPRLGVMVWFFYKDPRLPFSDDRFSYGAIVVKRGESVLPGEQEAILAFLRSGLDPRQRPGTLRRTLPFTVPR